MTDRNHADLRQGIVDTCREMNRNGLHMLVSARRHYRTTPSRPSKIATLASLAIMA